MRDSWQLLVDCPHCLVESAIVEVVEAASPAPRSLERRCRMCGYTTELDALRASPRRFRSADDVAVALAAWAHEEGDHDLEQFCAANFAGLSLAAVTTRVLAHERVETGFDVIAWLFPGSSTGGARAPDPRNPAVRAQPALRSPGPTGRTQSDAPPIPAPEPRPTYDPVHAARALYAAALADGKLRAREAAVIQSLLPTFGAPDLPEDARRVWRPTEVSLPPDPAALLAAMRKVALCDGDLDGSELRVLREYARAWGTPLNERGLRPEATWARVGRAVMALFYTAEPADER